MFDDEFATYQEFDQLLITNRSRFICENTTPFIHCGIIRTGMTKKFVFTLCVVSSFFFMSMNVGSEKNKYIHIFDV